MPPKDGLQDISPENVYENRRIWNNVIIILEIITNRIPFVGDQKGFCAHSGGRRRCLGSGMTAANDDHIVVAPI